MLQSVIDYKTLLERKGASTRQANCRVGDLLAHALVCKTRADTQRGAFREFVVYACKMTRGQQSGIFLIGGDAGKVFDDERTAACEALFDLIMEGV